MITRVPAGTSTRFALLIAAVAATSAIVLTNIYVFVPSKVERFNSTYVRCTQQRNADPDWNVTAKTNAEWVQKISAVRRWQACLRPVFLDEALFVGYGIGVVFGLSGVLYLLHPTWCIRRRRLEPLLAEDAPELVDYLNDLCSHMRVTPPKAWLLSPSERVSGQAFGLPGRRYVQLDAGLIPRYVTDRPAFRVVVMHELAHLRNRDVDKTYFTLAIWWAFVAAAVVPFLALIVHPLLLSAPLTWNWRYIGQAGGGLWHTTYVVGGLLALTGLVYLTRNAILRVREIEADAVAAAFDDPKGAMAAVLDQLPERAGPFWRTRFGTHPSAQARRRAVTKPRTLLRAGLWELGAIGITAGMLCVNLTWVLHIVVIGTPVLTSAIIGLLAGMPMTAMLGVAVWRATAADPAASPSARTWLAAPLSLVAGYVAGSAMLLRMFQPWDGLLPFGTVAAATGLFALGTVLVTAWLVSAARPILAAHSSRWAMPAVVSASVVAAAPWCAVWFAFRQQTGAWTPVFGRPPDPAITVGWYREVARWTGLGLQPLDYVYANPITLPGLALLWLIPILAANHRRQAINVRSALAAGLIGSIVMVAVAAVLPFLTRAALPLAARYAAGLDPTAGTAPFALVYNDAYTALALLTQAIVAVVVAARIRRHRPALTLLAVLLTSALAVVALFWVSLPIGRCINLYGQGAGPCFVAPSLGHLADVVARTTINGVIIAIPAALLGSTLGTWLQRTAENPAQPDTRPRRFGHTIAAAAIILLAATSIAGSTIGLEHAYQVWIGWSV